MSDRPRIIAIGDIHGCAMALQTLLKAISPTKHDLLIPLGDMIDYGPDTCGVLQQLHVLRDQTQLLLLTGNHEEMLWAVLDQQRELDHWTRHGGIQTLQAYGIEHPKDLPAEDLALLRTARPFHETASHLFVHAGYYPNQSLCQTPSSVLWWEFLEPQRAYPHCSGKTVIVGHTPQTNGDVLDLGFLVCIDTDCSRGNWLTALDVTSGMIWQANQRGQLRCSHRT
jgi:serine/threonine protein phosphatase 1